ncbi:MAG TPA: chemotaxis protein CheB [Puia sp.]|nr:chemotaxis protein CheB [Puia sp.]
MSELHEENNEEGDSFGLFPVVGVGASAGGLDAFKRLIKEIPVNSGMAIVLVQHLEPTHESILTDLLQKSSPIPVQEISNNVLIEPNHIYVIPSNSVLIANEGRLQLTARPPRNQKNMPIDLFFTSLAEVYQNHAIGVVLSGTATDGTLGLKEIKEHGGFTFAQEPGSASFDGMPRSAIDAEVVDFILSPEDIAFRLSKLTDTFLNGQKLDAQGQHPSKDEAFRELLQILLFRKGTDFTYYKQTTVGRRILRRMALSKKENIVDYLAWFRENAAEQDLLYQDLLIPVSGFFRDPAVYATLCESLFPKLLKEKDQVNPLRIWIAGCSTGEEPYSMAICLHEYLEGMAPDCKIQIFATDVSENSIAKARMGVYSKRDVTGLDEARLEKYFVKNNGNFQIAKSIRDMCVFAVHNFLKDPPFAKMDFVSCRNVLIYMEPFLQKRALTTFHYALNENGYLLLGNSETVAPAAELFTAFVDNKFKIYIRKQVQGRYLYVSSGRNERSSKNNVIAIRKETGRDDFQRSADEVLLNSYTPPGVVVNDQMDIVQFRGSTGTWLEASPGKPSLNVLRMAREGLGFELRNALYKAKTNNRTEVKEHIPFKMLNRQQWVTVEVVPLQNTVEPYYLILFREVLVLPGNTGELPTQTQGLVSTTGITAEGLYIQQLEKELALLREDMRSITEDQEAVNEELQSTNEELLSGSEELQSLNEELETSKEEIQSTNEELMTLNQELFDRNEQLNISRLYAESIVSTIREPLIVLDKNFKIRTANRAYYQKFNSSEEMTEGKLLFTLGNGQWDTPDLHHILDEVREKNLRVTDFPMWYSFEEAGERALVLNACQIFRTDNAELMILLALEDITDMKKREEDMLLFSRKLEKKVDERTASLQEANISLKISNSNLEQFATIASHDLQEPLRKIRTFSSILNQRHSEDLDGESKELLSKISRSAERMSSLIDAVLNFSRVLDASVFEDTDLELVLERVTGDFDLLISQKEAVIHHDPLPVIKAVPLQMNQLFYNLLGNALKFSRTGVAPVIDISCRVMRPEELTAPLNKDRKHIEMVWKDNGIGFHPKYAKQIFKIFQRLNASEHFEGTGIGLALCQKIVLNHRGEISADSEKNIGTQFRIILPTEQ